jgi:CubicO group peptidase (beta-lactamase class C family)
MGAAALGAASSPARAQIAEASAGKHLSRSTPEAQGVSSVAVLEFLDRARSMNELHSFMMVRHGYVIAEGWWAPYRAGAIHGLYSLSKSFTSTAVGFGVSEGKLNVADRVVHFFPDKLPANVSENLAQLRVRDLLTMSLGRATDSTDSVIKENDWVKAFLSMPIQHEPGSVFLYDSAATYILSAIVQKVTGQQLIDYLRPRLFEPLQASGMRWESCPLGINCGGWGLSATTETLAKFGQLYLQRGTWNGRQVLPTQWVDEATTFKIQQPPTTGIHANPSNADLAGALRKLQQTSDWHQGYCYQFWRSRHNAFRGDGAYGQYCVVMPDQDAVIAITSETGDMQAVLELMWDSLLPAMHFGPLPQDAPSAGRLRRELSSLALPLPRGAATSVTMDRIQDKTFELESNSLRMESVSFRADAGTYVVRMKHPRGASEVRFGMAKWVDGETDMPGMPPTLIAHDMRDMGPSKLTAAGAWKDDATLELQWRFYETPHRDTVVCSFQDGQVEIRFMSSISQLSPSDRPERRPVLRGHIVA